MYFIPRILIENRSFQVSCQFNMKSGAIDQLTLGHRPVDRDRLVGHPWSKKSHGFGFFIWFRFNPGNCAVWPVSEPARPVVTVVILLLRLKTSFYFNNTLFQTIVKHSGFHNLSSFVEECVQQKEWRPGISLFVSDGGPICAIMMFTLPNEYHIVDLPSMSRCLRMAYW